jgi:manganese-dependent inorganic pyrophosphatase
MAGIILSAILSDTLLLKSPTTTRKDRVLAHKLAKAAKINLYNYGREMLEAGCDIINHSANKIILTDFKNYSEHGQKVGVGQAPVIGFEKALKRRKELLEELNRIQKKNYLAVMLMVTDVLAGNTYFFFSGEEERISHFFHKKVEKIPGTEGGFFYLPKVVSRKKQVQPLALELLR